MKDNPVLDWLRGPLGIGTLLLALFGGAVVFGLNAVHGMPIVPRTEVKVAFDDLSGLNTGDDVRIAGKRVGYVDDLRLEDGHAVAVLKLDDPDIKLYENAQAARIADRSGLGQKFVILDPGEETTGPLRSGATIPAEQTVKAEDINEVLDVFDPETRRQATTSLQNLGSGMIGHSPDLHAFTKDAPGILTDTGTVSAALAANGGAPLAELLETGNRLSTRLATRDEELAALIDELAVTADAFAVDEANQARAALDRAPDTLAAAHGALRTLDEPLKDLAVAMRTVRPGATALGETTPGLRALLREGVDPVAKVPGVNKVATGGVKALDRLVLDARPLAQQSIKTGANGGPLAGVLGSYSQDMAQYYIGGASALGQGDAEGHWLRILLLPGLESAGVGTAVTRDPYPEPGETW